MEKIIQLKLPNGMRAILVPRADSASVIVLALYAVGSRHETDRLAGASHFLEHMLLRGTDRHQSQLELAKWLDAVGAEYNAFTGKDHTGYYVRVTPDRLKMAADAVEEIVYRSLLRPEVVDAERSIITEEMRMIMDDPMRLVDDQLDAAVYAGSPLARFICGTPESVLGIGRDELVAYRDAHYRPERTVVVVAGAFNPAVARRLVKERFGRQKSLGRKPAVASKVRPPLDGPRLKLLDKPTEQAHLALGFPAVRLGDSRLPAVKMLSVILGGGMSSRLFSEVREKRGLAYAVWSHCHTYEDTGHFSVQLGTSPDKAVTALEVAIGELRRIATEGVSVAELAAAKEFVKGKTLMAMDDPGALAEFYGKQALMEGKVETLKARIAKLQAVTPAKVKAAAQMIFRPGRASFAAIGPFQDEAPFLRAIAKL